jgi:ComEC/Rec2-related protein
MRLPFLWIALAVTTGSVLSFIVAVHPVFLWIAATLTIPVLGGLRGRKGFLPVFIFTAAILSWIYADFRYRVPSDGIETQAGEGGEKVSLKGSVVSVPEVQTSGGQERLSFVLAASYLYRGKAGALEGKKARGRVLVFLSQPEFFPECGDTVRLRGQLQKPSAALNPGNFDFRNYLGRRNIRAVLRARGYSGVRILRKGEGMLPLRKLGQIRDFFRRRLEGIFPPGQACFFKALILGDRKGIPAEWTDDFLRTGTSHLLAISGLNITMAVGSLYVLLVASGLSQKPAACLGLLGTWAYVFIAGAEVPVMRAGWMAGTAFFSLLVEREKNPFNTFFLAYVLVWLSEPQCLATVSFQLTFLSVLALMVCFCGRDGTLRWFEVFSQTIGALMGTFPLVAYHFNLFAPAGIFSNLLAIPLFHLGLLSAFMALALSAVPFFGPAAAAIAGFWLHLGLEWIRFLAKFGWGYFYLPTPPAWQMALYYLLLVAVVFPGMIKFPVSPVFRKILGAAFCVTACSFFVFRPPSGFCLTQLASGRNGILHLTLDDGRQWLIGRGNSFSGESVRRVAAPYLRFKGIRHLDGVILTEWHSKNRGFFEDLRRHFRVDRIWMPEPARGGDPVRRVIVSGRDFEMAMLSAGGGRAVLSMTYRGRGLAVFPSLDRRTLGMTGYFGKKAGASDVLILPYTTQFRGEDFEVLRSQMAPRVTILPVAGTRAKTELLRTKTPCLEAAKTGALMIRPVFERDRFLSWEVTSFLSGVLGYF